MKKLDYKYMRNMTIKGHNKILDTLWSLEDQDQMAVVGNMIENLDSMCDFYLKKLKKKSLCMFFDKEHRVNYRKYDLLLSDVANELESAINEKLEDFKMCNEYINKKPAEVVVKGFKFY